VHEESIVGAVGSTFQMLLKQNKIQTRQLCLNSTPNSNSNALCLEGDVGREGGGVLDQYKSLELVLKKGGVLRSVQTV
jgi:hypothetical protein